MWKGNNDVNDEGESILLLEPRTNSNQKRSKKQNFKRNAKLSMLGGIPTFFENDTNPPLTTINSTNPKCVRCSKSLFLILQLNAPIDSDDDSNPDGPGLDRTLYVFGCNQASCIQSLFHRNEDDTKSRFHENGGGVIVCLRSQCLPRTDGKRNSDEKQLSKNHSTTTIKQNTNSNWDLDSNWEVDEMDKDTNYNTYDEDTSMDEIEKLLAKMEAKEKNTKTDASCKKNDNIRNRSTKSNTNENSSNKNKTDDASSNITHDNDIPSFPCHELDLYDEPQNRRKMTLFNSNSDDNDDDDDDMIGISDSSLNDSKIQSMLSKYLSEEDDEEIINILDSNRASSKGCNKNTNTSLNKTHTIKNDDEKYERLNPDDKALFTFSDRIHRSPYQVARYAYGGVALWSVPTPLTPSTHFKKTKNISPAGKHFHRKQQCRDVTFPIIPKCPCGAERAFEFQVMPYALHLLDVENHLMDDSCSVKNNTSADAKRDNDMNNGQNVCSNEMQYTHESLNDNIGLVMNKESGGMNWGVIAVYSCSASCELYREEYVIVQESLDGTPVKRSQQVVERMDDDDNDTDDANTK